MVTAVIGSDEMDKLIQDIEAFCEAIKMKPATLFALANMHRSTWRLWKNGAGGATIASEGKIRAAMDKIKSDLGASQ